MQQSLQSFLISVLAGLLLIVLEKWLFPRLAKNSPLYRKYYLFVFLCLFVILNIIYKSYFPQRFWDFVLITAIIFGWIIFRELNQFWVLGMVGADRETRLGISYKKALSLCTSSFDFLGIGAGKLRSEQSAFEAAIDRCSRPDRSIRFLLCRPDSEGLRRIAQSAGRSEDSYRKVVLESLRTLAILKNERAKNIQVRLYTEFPVFRLMFINDEICLASHYVLGKGGDGSNAPQIHIVKTKSPDIESLYYGFHWYFERIWQDSIDWDFKTYL